MYFLNTTFSHQAILRGHDYVNQCQSIWGYPCWSLYKLRQIQRAA